MEVMKSSSLKTAVYIVLGFFIFSSVNAENKVTVNEKKACDCLEKISRNKDNKNYSCSELSSHSSLVANVSIKPSNIILAKHINYITNKNFKKNNNLETALKVRQEISELYACTGFINSGAILKTHDKNTTEYEIIEGTLAKKNISIKGNKRLKNDYIKKKIIGSESEVTLNYNKIRENLEILRKNPLVRSIKASVHPVSRGKAGLDVILVENKPYQAQVKINNYQSKSLGEKQIILEGSFFPSWREEDRLYAKVTLSEKGGSKNVDVGYRWRLHDKGIVSLNLGKKQSIVISPPFDDLEIESDVNTVSLKYSHEISKRYTLDSEQTNAYTTQTFHTKLEIFDSSNTLLGRPFSFSLGENEGKSRVSSLIVQYEISKASRKQALSGSIGLDFGLDLFASTVNDNKIADGRYISLIGQLQYKTLLPINSLLAGSQLHLNLNGKISKDKMLSSKKFTFGGAQTVRGIDQNLISRDSGLTASAEISVPLGSWNILNDDSPLSGKLILLPFVDYGIAKNNHADKSTRASALTTGVGIKWNINKKLKLESYWAKAIHSSGLTKQQKQSTNDGKFYLQTAYTWGGS
jgi:hemolysin activation/secretion protein